MFWVGFLVWVVFWGLFRCGVIGIECTSMLILPVVVVSMLSCLLLAWGGEG